MHLAATAPLMAPPDLLPLARDVFLTLAKVRFASVPSLLALAGPSGLTMGLLDLWVDAGLFHEGIVRLDPIRGTEVRYVALAPAGARALALASGQYVGAVSPSRLKRSSQKRCHDVAVGDVALAITALEREGLLDVLALETDDRRLATSVVMQRPGEAPDRVALQADAYVLVQSDDGPRATLIEVDRGTTSPSRLQEKYAAYLAWKGERGPERDFRVRALRVLTIAPSARRSEKLHQAALDASDGKRSGFLLFANSPDIAPQDPTRLFEPIARALGSDIRVPIFMRPSGQCDPQVRWDPAGGTPPGAATATLPAPEGRGVSSRPLAVTAFTRALML